MGLLILVGTGACERYPQDPDRSLEQILERGSVRVGISAHPPWVTGTAPATPGGVEPAMVQAWAGAQNVTVSWEWGHPQSLLERLRSGDLDVVIGGLTADNPWKKHLGFSLAWYQEEVILAVPSTMPHPDGIGDLAIEALRDAPWLQRLREEDATVLAMEQLSGERPAAVERWRLPIAGLEATEHVISRSGRVLAVPSGENALLMSLEEHFLSFGEDQVAAAAREATR